MSLFRRFKNSRGQMADIMMFMLFVVFVIYFIVSYTSMHQFFKTQEFTDSIVRSEVETVRSKGILKTEDHERYMRELARYGKFIVHVTLEKQNSAGYYDKFFRIEEILDKPLKVGDFIKIIAESNDTSLFAEIMRRGILFGSSKNTASFRMQSLASGMVCSDGYIKGLEVVNIIEKYRTRPSPPFENITVRTLKNIENNDPGVPYNSSTAYDHEAARGTDNEIKFDARFRMDIDKTDDMGNITKMTMIELRDAYYED